jgi:hypothetical protein
MNHAKKVFNKAGDPPPSCCSGNGKKPGYDSCWAKAGRSGVINAFGQVGAF